MKIVHICLSNFFIDDYSYQENMLPKYHVLQGHDVTVLASLVSFDKNGRPSLLDSESVVHDKGGFKVVRINYKKPGYKINKFVRRYNSTLEKIRSENPDILFIHDYSFFDIIKVINYAKEQNIRVFVDCHTDYINSAKSWISKHVFHHIIWRAVGAYISPFVEVFYGVTPLRCDFLRDAYKIPNNKIKLLEMGVDDYVINQKRNNANLYELRKLLAPRGDEFLVITGGKIDLLKNIHLVMEAFKELNPKNAKLIVFGNLAPEIADYINEFFKMENIVFVGWLDSSSILEYFMVADLVVFPGTHSVLWEQAVGIGTPCLFKYWKGMTNVDIGGNCKFLYKNSANEIKSVLDEVINSKEVYNKMREVASGVGREKFFYSDIAKRSIE